MYTIRNCMEISCAVCPGYFLQFLKNRLCFLKVRPIFFATWNTQIEELYASVTGTAPMVPEYGLDTIPVYLRKGSRGF